MNRLVSVSVPELSVRPRRVSWLFPFVTGLLLVGVFVGFAKTFFLRSHFNVPQYPGYLDAHGALLTTWFALVFAQSFLVAAHRTDLHRRLGAAAALVAALVIPVSAYVVFRAAQRPGPITPLLQIEVVGDLLSLIWFLSFVGIALWYRRRRLDIHKRLMIASCFTIYGPVFARFELVYRLPIVPPAVLPFGLVVLVGYDLLLTRRVHRATVWIGVSWFGGLLLVLGGLMASGVAEAIIRGLRGA